MNIIIAGGRDFSDYQLLCKHLGALLEYENSQGRQLVVVCGEAKGADALGKRWAKENKVGVVSYPANWGKYGKAAGPIRNREMAKISQELFAFWDGKSKGTKNMIDVAKELNLNVTIVKYNWTGA